MMSSANTRSVKKPVTAIRKMNSQSTFPAPAEACTGHSGTSWKNMLSLSSPVRSAILGARFQAEHDDQKASQHNNREDTRDLQYARDDGAVLPGSRIVVIAIKQYLVDHVADLVLRGLHKRQPQIPGSVFHAVKILGNLALRRDHHDRGSVRKLLRLLIPRVLKTKSVRQRLDVRLVPGQEVPALSSSGTSVTSDHRVLLGCG